MQGNAEYIWATNSRSKMCFHLLRSRLHEATLWRHRRAAPAGLGTERESLWTLTGLLIEGDYTQNPVNERNGDFSTNRRLQSPP